MIDQEPNYFWIIGGGVLQLPLIEEVKKLNYEIIVTDGDANCICKNKAPYFEAIDIFNIDDFDKPIYVNNREFRTENTTNYFEQSMIEANSFEKENGIIKNTNLITEVDCPVCEDTQNRQLFVKWGFKIV